MFLPIDDNHCLFYVAEFSLLMAVLVFLADRQATFRARELLQKHIEKDNARHKKPKRRRHHLGIAAGKKKKP
jgi:hypothetical protein